MPKSAVFCLFYLATFLQAGTYGLTFLLPKLFSDFGANEKHVGLMLLITTATTLVSVYYSGHLTDKIGRMTSLAISGFAISMALAMFGWADSLSIVVVLASALLGFGWGTFYSLGPVVMTRITTPDERVRVFSFHSVFIMAGFGLSPVMASTLESFGFSVSHAFYVMTIVCVISGCIFITIRPAVQTLSTGATAEQRSRLSLITVLNICTSPAKLPITMVCLGASVFAGLNNFQTVFAEARALNYADFFLAYTVTVIICRLLLAGFSGGKSPYLIIAGLQYVMFASIVLFIYSANSQIFVLSRRGTFWHWLRRVLSYIGSNGSQ